jgi:hypothetical protein
LSGFEAALSLLFLRIKMFCPKCGKENPEGAKFCMHCGADLSGYKVEISPKVEVSPKISVSAKAEGGVALKWKKKPDGYVEVEEYGRLPLYRDFVKLEDKPFCPFCGNYACLESEECIDKGFSIFDEDGREKEVVYGDYVIKYCVACNKKLTFVSEGLRVSPEFERYLYVKGDTLPVYKNVAGRYWRRGALFSSEYLEFEFARLCNTEWVVYCPACKEKCEHAPNTTNTVWCRERVYCLYMCEKCGKFLVFIRDWRINYPEKGVESIMKFPYLVAHPICDLCNNAAGKYTCSGCDKQICEQCAVTVEVKKGLFSKETVKLCPDCAKDV